MSVGQETYRDLAQRETDLQKQLIKLSEENIELRFECEQAKKDIPRLKVSARSRKVQVYWTMMWWRVFDVQERVEEQQKYTEILKEEKRQLEIMRSSARSIDSLGSLGSSLSGNYKRVSSSTTSASPLRSYFAVSPVSSSFAITN